MRDLSVLNHINETNEENPQYSEIQRNLNQEANRLHEELETLKNLRDNHSQYFSNAQNNAYILNSMDNYLITIGAEIIDSDGDGFSDTYIYFNGNDYVQTNNPLELIEKGVDVNNETYESFETALYEKQLYDENINALNKLIHRYEVKIINECLNLCFR